jgi:FixJ family two-component response regulator
MAWSISEGIEARLFASQEESLQPGGLESIGCLITDVLMAALMACELHRNIAALPS